MPICGAPNESQDSPLVCDVPLPCSCLCRSIWPTVLAEESLEGDLEGTVELEQEILCVEPKSRSLARLSSAVEAAPCASRKH